MATLLCSPAAAVYELVEVAESQHLKRIEGIVQDRAGAALPGTRIDVTLHGDKKVLATAVSHLDGHFVVHHLHPGFYDVHLAARGMNPMLWHVELNAQGSKNLWIVKMPIGG